MQSQFHTLSSSMYNILVLEDKKQFFKETIWPSSNLAWNLCLISRYISQLIGYCFVVQPMSWSLSPIIVHFVGRNLSFKWSQFFFVEAWNAKISPEEKTPEASNHHCVRPGRSFWLLRLETGVPVDPSPAQGQSSCYFVIRTGLQFVVILLFGKSFSKALFVDFKNFRYYRDKLCLKYEVCPLLCSLELFGYLVGKSEMFSRKGAAALVLVTGAAALYLVGGRRYFAARKMHRTEDEVNAFLKRREKARDADS